MEFVQGFSLVHLFAIFALIIREGLLITKIIREVEISEIRISGPKYHKDHIYTPPLIKSEISAAKLEEK